MSRSGALNLTVAYASATQIGTQFLRAGTVISPDVDVGPTHAAAPQSMVNDVGLATAQDGCVLLLQSAIGSERSLVSRAAHQCYAPDRRRLTCWRGCAGHEPSNVSTRDGLF